MVAPATGLVTCAAIAVRPGAFCAAAGDTASNDAPIIRAAENFIQSTPQVFAGCAWELVSIAAISRPSNQVSPATRRASSARHITCVHDSKTGSAHACTPVTNAQLEYPHLLEKKKTK